MNDPEKASIFRELAKLLKADFHLDRSFDLLLNQKPKPALAQFLRAAKERLGSGAGVTEALRQDHQGGLTALDLALVAAGENSGRLAQSFTLLARYYESVVESARKARSAMIYPLILAHLGVILPELPAAIAGDSLAELPLRILSRLGILWVILLIVFRGWRALSKSAETSHTTDRLLGSLPLLGPMRQHWALARFTQVAHSALLAALRPQEWIRLAGEASGSGQFNPLLRHCEPVGVFPNTSSTLSIPPKKLEPLIMKWLGGRNSNPTKPANPWTASLPGCPKCSMPLSPCMWRVASLA